MNQWAGSGLLVPIVLLAMGCGEPHSHLPTEPAPTAVLPPKHIDSPFAGVIAGKVVWTGPIPEVPPFEIRTFVTASNPARPRPRRENPNTPVVNIKNQGVGHAVVFLRKVEPSKVAAWNLPSVEVEFRDNKLVVLQGGVESNVGFVHKGETISMVSRAQKYHSLHAGGAAFFTLPFPDANKPLKRKLNSAGLVELSCGSGDFWMRAYLFVSDHPHFARTDAEGNFELTKVHPGRYELVCWMPNWNKKGQDRDPETSLVTRIFFHDPLELRQDVDVPAVGTVRTNFEVKADLFAR